MYLLDKRLSGESLIKVMGFIFNFTMVEGATGTYTCVIFFEIYNKQIAYASAPKIQVRTVKTFTKLTAGVLKNALLLLVLRGIV